MTLGRANNIIEWRFNHDKTCVTGYNNFKHYFEINLNTNRVITQLYCKGSIIYNATSLDDAKKYCQNILIDYLKGLNDLIQEKQND